MNDFIAQYHTKVYTAVARLSALSEEAEITLITENILSELWDNKKDLLTEQRSGTFIYKVLLIHVLIYLKDAGHENRIQDLQKILLLDPAHFDYLLEEP